MADLFAVLDLTDKTIAEHPGFVVVRRGANGPILALCPIFEEKVSDGQFTYAWKVQRALNHHDALVTALRSVIALAPTAKPESPGDLSEMEDGGDLDAIAEFSAAMARWEAAEIARPIIAEIDAL